MKFKSVGDETRRERWCSDYEDHNAHVDNIFTKFVINSSRWTQLPPEPQQTNKIGSAIPRLQFYKYSSTKIKSLHLQANNTNRRLKRKKIYQKNKNAEFRWERKRGHFFSPAEETRFSFSSSIPKRYIFSPFHSIPFLTFSFKPDNFALLPIIWTYWSASSFDFRVCLFVVLCIIWGKRLGYWCVISFVFDLI